MIESQTKPKRILSIVEVLRRCVMSRSALYQKLNINSPYYDPDFPVQVKLGVNAVGWVESEIEEWIDHRIALRNAKLLQRDSENLAIKNSQKSQLSNLRD